MTPPLHPNPHKKTKQLVIKQIPQKERQLHKFMFDHSYKKHKNKQKTIHTHTEPNVGLQNTNSQKQRNEYLTTIREHQFAGNYQNEIPKSGNLSIAVDYRKPIANLMPL